MTSILASDTFAADVLRLLVLGSTHANVAALLARGLDDQASGRAIGRSARTVRREVARIANANGVHGRISAGALFEALAWH